MPENNEKIIERPDNAERIVITSSKFDLYTILAVIAASAMAIFGNLLVVMNPPSIIWNFWVTLAGVVVIGLCIYLEMTKKNLSFFKLPLWMKIALWVGIYVFVTNLFGYFKMVGAFYWLQGIPRP
ncbi:MAG: hypothetical protein GX421_05485 [Caldisericales bacterium]|nr:hypothetical protein [Caldisericales bacterium]